MKIQENPSTGFAQNSPVHLCLLVDNHVAGGVDTFLKLLLPRLNSPSGRVRLFVNSSYPNLDLLKSSCRNTTDVFTYESVFHHRWFTRMGSKEPSVRVAKVIGALRRISEYLLLPLEILRIRHTLPIPSKSVLMVVNGGYPGSYVALSAALAFAPKMKLIMNIHNFAASRSRATYLLDSYLDRQITNHVKLFIGVSSSSEASLKKRFRKRPIRSTYVYNAIDPSDSVRPQVSQEGQQRREKDVIALVGTLEPRKGHLFALDLLSELNRSRNRKTLLRFIGSDPFNFGEQVKSRARRLGVFEDVEFCGYQVSRSAIYSGLDVVVVPSTALESFCYVAIEALAEGVRVVASSTGALPEILDGLPSCRVVPELDVHDWTCVISDLLDEDSSSTISTPRSQFLRYLDPQQMAEEYQRLIDELCTRSS